MGGPPIVPHKTRVVLDDDGRRGMVIRLVNARSRLAGAIRVREPARVVVICDDGSRAERPVAHVTVES